MFCLTIPSDKVSLLVTLVSDYWNLFLFLLIQIFYSHIISHCRVKSTFYGSNYFIFDRKYSIRRKCPIFRNVDILSVVETKLDPSFHNSQFLIPEPMRLDPTSKLGEMLVYIKSLLSSRIGVILSHLKKTKSSHLNWISRMRSGRLSVFKSHLYKVIIISLTLWMIC